MPLPNEAAYEALETYLRTTVAPEFDADIAANNDQVIADALNAPQSPAFWAWRTAVPRSEYLFATSVDGTTFTFTGNGFVGRSQGELAGWDAIFTKDTDTTNPSLPKVRDAFADIFSGTGNAVANRTHLATVSRRVVTRAERLFATGTGSTGSPGTLVFEGDLNNRDIAHALRGAPL
jgi:hypothetical protein